MQQLRSRLYTVHFGHDHIHEHDVRARTPGFLKCNAAVGCHPDDSNVFSRFQQHLEAVTHYCVIIYDQHANGPGRSCTVQLIFALIPDFRAYRALTSLCNAAIFTGMKQVENDG